MNAGAHLAEIGFCIGDPSRAAMLWSLMGGESRPASELAMLANVSPQTASSHLKTLVTGRLLDVSPSGRTKFYKLSHPSVAAALESLMFVARPEMNATGIAGRTAPELVFARTCYDHLAGELAVRILKRLLDRGLLEESGKEFSLTGSGKRFFESLGIKAATALEKRRRRLAYPCLDWSQRLPHLAGSLGAELLNCFLRSHVLAHGKVRRAIRVTDRGREMLEHSFGIRLSRDGRIV